MWLLILKAHYPDVEFCLTAEEPGFDYFVRTNASLVETDDMNYLIDCDFTTRKSHIEKYEFCTTMEEVNKNLREIFHVAGITCDGLTTDDIQHRIKEMANKNKDGFYYFREFKLVDINDIE